MEEEREGLRGWFYNCGESTVGSGILGPPRRTRANPTRFVEREKKAGTRETLTHGPTRSGTGRDRAWTD
jgi:hypothetical protein